MRCYGSIMSGGIETRLHRRISITANPNPNFTSHPNSRLFFSNYRRRLTPFRSIKANATTNNGFVKEVMDLSFYELLGISESDSLVEIKQAYKQLARKYHPDVSPPDRVVEYTQRFIRVQEAYETLSDPRRRAMYDGDMAVGLHLAFSARRWNRSEEELEDTSEWKNHWQAQVSELKRRSVNRDERGDMSWGARMRRQREKASN